MKQPHHQPTTDLANPHLAWFCRPTGMDPEGWANHSQPQPDPVATLSFVPDALTRVNLIRATLSCAPCGVVHPTRKWQECSPGSLLHRRPGKRGESIGGSAYFDVGPGSAIPSSPRLGVGWTGHGPVTVRDWTEKYNGLCIPSAPVLVDLGS